MIPEPGRRKGDSPQSRFVLAVPLYQEAADSLHPKPTKAFAGAVAMKLGLEDLFTRELAAASANKKALNAWIMDKDGPLLFQSHRPEIVLRNIHQSDSSCAECHGSFDYAHQIVKLQQAVEYEMRDALRALAASAPQRRETPKRRAPTAAVGVQRHVGQSCGS